MKLDTSPRCAFGVSGRDTEFVLVLATKFVRVGFEWDVFMRFLFQFSVSLSSFFSSSFMFAWVRRVFAHIAWDDTFHCQFDRFGIILVQTERVHLSLEL
jgi:hypothetical protein